MYYRGRTTAVKLAVVAAALAVSGCTTSWSRFSAPATEGLRSISRVEILKADHPETRIMEQPEVEVIDHGGRITEIKTNGLDINIEDYLKPEMNTIVQFGAFWCKPCVYQFQIIKQEILEKGTRLDDFDFVYVDLAHVQVDGKTIGIPSDYWEKHKFDNYIKEYGGTVSHSPATRYFPGDQDNIGFPFYLLYQGTRFIGRINYDPYKGYFLPQIVNNANELKPAP